MELTQTQGFGVGIFWRNVILERVMITRSYEPKVHLCGRGGEILDQSEIRTDPRPPTCWYHYDCSDSRTDSLN